MFALSFKIIKSEKKSELDSFYFTFMEKLI